MVALHQATIEKTLQDHRIPKSLISRPASDQTEAIIALIKQKANVQDIVDCIAPENPIEWTNNDTQHYGLLHFAARYNHLPLVRYLIAQGANVNAVTGMQSNALHYAFEASDGLKKTLVYAGCKHNAINRFGNRADAHMNPGAVTEIPVLFKEAMRHTFGNNDDINNNNNDDITNNNNV